MHMGEIEPDEKGCTRSHLPLYEVLGRRCEVIVAGLHALLGQRTCVLDLLLPYPAEALICGGIVGFALIAGSHRS